MARTDRPTGSLAGEISERLILEYAGAVPPGRILAQAVRVERRLHGLNLEPESRRLLIEQTVRQRLVLDTRVGAVA